MNRRSWLTTLIGGLGASVVYATAPIPKAGSAKVTVIKGRTFTKDIFVGDPNPQSCIAILDCEFHKCDIRVQAHSKAHIVVTGCMFTQTVEDQILIGNWPATRGVSCP